jgi:SP family sugar porter-like MFS transporter
MAIVFGILLAQIVNWLIARPVLAGTTPHEILASWNGQVWWRWMFGVTAIPALLFLVATFLVPESPRWLAAKGRSEQALRVLERLGGQAYARQVIEDFRVASGDEPRLSFLRELSSPGLV